MSSAPRARGQFPVDSLHGQRPFTIALQNALERDTPSTFVLIGDVEDVWRDTGGVTVRFVDRSVSSVFFDLRCPRRKVF